MGVLESRPHYKKPFYLIYTSIKGTLFEILLARGWGRGSGVDDV